MGQNKPITIPIARHCPCPEPRDVVATLTALAGNSSTSSRSEELDLPFGNNDQFCVLMAADVRDRLLKRGAYLGNEKK
jgi:hypothetical protein